MSHNNGEVRASLCRGTSLCVYGFFDVHHKYLLKGHHIAMTQSEPRLYMLIIQENCLRHWRIINIKTRICSNNVAAHRSRPWKTLQENLRSQGVSTSCLCCAEVILCMKSFPCKASIICTSWKALPQQ